MELVPLSEAQEYLKDLGPAISEADGEPVYLSHDGETGTSDDFVSDIYEHVRTSHSLEGSVLLEVLQKLIKSENSFHIWWANNRPDAWQKVADIDSPKKLFEYVLKRAYYGTSMVLAYCSRIRSGLKNPMLTCDL